jgi:hypothetical protein
MSEITQTAVVCVNHPNRSTGLRCSRCSDPICPDCAVLTPTGYRCRKCLRQQQKVYDTARWWDYPVSAAIAIILGYAGSYIASFLGFFTIFVAPIAGVIIAEAARSVIKRRRGKRLFQAITAAAVLGSLPLLLVRLVSVLAFLSAGQFSFFAILPLIWSGVFTFLMASTLYYRLSGIQMRR